MTRPFNQTTHCQNCKTWSTSETLFGRWIRNNPSLDSRDGFSVIDQDYWVHRFKVDGNRLFQCLMLVEIKTNSAELTAAQRDTLHVINQLMRNRRSTPTKHDPQCGNTLKVVSTFSGKKAELRAYGMHVLRFSGLGPDDSKEMWWNKTRISVDQLTALLRFDLDPDSLRPIDLRNHHMTINNQVLELGLDAGVFSEVV